MMQTAKTSFAKDGKCKVHTASLAPVGGGRSGVWLRGLPDSILVTSLCSHDGIDTHKKTTASTERNDGHMNARAICTMANASVYKKRLSFVSATIDYGRCPSAHLHRASLCYQYEYMTISGVCQATLYEEKQKILTQNIVNAGRLSTMGCIDRLCMA